MNETPYIAISILLKGDRLNPDYISETLGIKPNQSQKKGEEKKSPRIARKAIAKIGLWRGGKTKSKSRTLSDIADEVLQMFKGCREPLDKIDGVDRAYLDVFIIHEKKDKSDTNVEFILSRDQILRVSQLGLAISVTVSFNDDK
jgi:hypothetical protein